MNIHVQSHKTDIYKKGVINIGTKLYNKKVDVVTNRQLKHCGSNSGRGHGFFPPSKRPVLFVPVLSRGVKRPMLEIVQPPLAPVKNAWSQPPVPYMLNSEAFSQARVDCTVLYQCNPTTQQPTSKKSIFINFSCTS